MRQNYKLAISILSADFANLKGQIADIEKAKADYLHLDIMDGHFVPNISIGLPVVESLKRVTKIPLDVHLMIEHPDKYINDFVNSGADLITVHVETGYHVHRTVDKIKSYNVKAGIALNPATSLNLIDEIIKYVDIVLIMTVNPGYGGQQLIYNCISKIKRLREIIDSEALKAEIQVDGGINEVTLRDVAEAGTDIFVIGNAVFASGNIYESIIKYKEIIKLCR